MAGSNLRDLILEQVAGTDWVSGQAVAERLGVSRTAVWKHIRALQAEGYPLEHIRGRGYRLSPDTDLICEQDFRDIACRAGFNHSDIRYCFRCGSTNDERPLMGSAVSSISLVSAEQQLKGRGRMGRPWSSPLCKSLYLSLGTSFSVGYEALSGLSLAIGAVVTDVLQTFASAPLSLKWPNDIHAGGKKLAGILVEVEAEQGGVVRVIAGLGINIHEDPLLENLDQPATCLSVQSETPVRRKDVLLQLLPGLRRLVERYPSEGFQAYKGLWNKYDSMIGRQVVVKGHDGRITSAGCYDGVDDLGRLRLKTADGVELVSAGELSLRSA